MRVQSAYTGRKVIDKHGLDLGVVTDVVYDQHTQRPEYLVVSPGPLRRSRFVPVLGARELGDGGIVVPWDRAWFRLSPPATPSRSLRSEDRRSIDVHYSS